MSTNGSQKLDIADICEAVVGSIRDDVTSIASAAASEVLTLQQMAANEQHKEINKALREIVYQLRIITGEKLTSEDVS